MLRMSRFCNNLSAFLTKIRLYKVMKSCYTVHIPNMEKIG